MKSSYTCNVWNILILAERTVLLPYVINLIQYMYCKMNKVIYHKRLDSIIILMTLSLYICSMTAVPNRIIYQLHLYNMLLYIYRYTYTYTCKHTYTYIYIYIYMRVCYIYGTLSILAGIASITMTIRHGEMTALMYTCTLLSVVLWSVLLFAPILSVGENNKWVQNHRFETLSA